MFWASLSRLLSQESLLWYLFSIQYAYIKQPQNTICKCFTVWDVFILSIVNIPAWCFSMCVFSLKKLYSLCVHIFVSIKSLHKVKGESQQELSGTEGVLQCIVDGCWTLVLLTMLYNQQNNLLFFLNPCFLSWFLLLLSLFLPCHIPLSPPSFTIPTSYCSNIISTSPVVLSPFFPPFFILSLPVSRDCICATCRVSVNLWTCWDWDTLKSSLI